MAEKRHVSSALRKFIASEGAGGLILIAAAALALVAANLSATASSYREFWHLEIGPVMAPGIGAMTLRLWINDALMALFFLLVGLEIKRELVLGELASWEQRRLPAIAAVTGMIVPALVYLAITHSTPSLHRGWAIPSATDIAFAICVLTVIGRRVPPSLKLFLTAVAIIDDIGAVVIIALFYTAHINLAALSWAFAILIVMIAAGRRGLVAPLFYLIAFAALWYCMLRSGVHATLAGVIAAIAVPVRTSAAGQHRSPLERLETGLQPWVAFAILPLFGFANAGVFFRQTGLDGLLAPLPLAVAAGLFFGKQLGIFTSTFAAVRLGIARRPEGASWTQIYGVAVVCGVGFTMSLFIGNLAFKSATAVDDVKLGVLIGSIGSALLGFVILWLAAARRNEQQCR